MNDTGLHERQDKRADFDQPTHGVPLTANRSGNLITISGPGNFSVGAGQAATHCQFTLTDNSGANVKFASLDTADNITGCPPVGSGNQSGEIVGITMNNNGPSKMGQFTDNNNVPGTVSYQWEFTCDSPFTVTPFDPIISNGGKSNSA
ncbi:hypothetical protein [Sphingomonas sp.]|uniref:hypothetical protein n=1 Tax=Sphingomonas sp. TaxID=28214 RepID=UPI0025F774B2|nr:hypothetical protein [Sphingomonas sp.]MBV9529108.1 hypothetical protein [Sphingomonas sp.]